MATIQTSSGNFASKAIKSGVPSAWGDLAETTEPMLGNLFGVFIDMPQAVKDAIPGQGIISGSVLSMLAWGATLPQEALTIEEVATKLSSYDVVVGKERGELELNFKEQAGAPVSMIMGAWHKKIVDARGLGISFPTDYAARVWVAALTGQGTPYFWWLFTRCFPKVRGDNPAFGNEQKNAIEIAVPFSYLEMYTGAEALAAAGSNFASQLQAAATSLGF